MLADQASKAWVQSKFSLFDSVALLPFLSLTYVHNTGVSFGMMRSLPGWFLLAVNALLTAAIYIFWRRRMAAGPGRWESRGLLLIFSGAVGNILDRARLGYVVDFIDLHFWPIFNLADSMITTGVCCYLVGSLIRQRK